MGSSFGRGSGGSEKFREAFSDMPGAKRGGIFGSGMDGNDFVNVLTRAAALSQGDYGGAAQIGSLIRKPQMDRQKREDDFADWQRQYDYQITHAKPVNNDTVADYDFIRQNLGEEAAKTFLQNKTDPPQYRQGPDGQFYRISPTGGAQQGVAPPSFTDDDWNSGTPLGGAGSGQPGFPSNIPSGNPLDPPRRRNRGY